jgi:hypothetical protein
MAAAFPFGSATAMLPSLIRTIAPVGKMSTLHDIHLCKSKRNQSRRLLVVSTVTGGVLVPKIRSPSLKLPPAPLLGLFFA